MARAEPARCIIATLLTRTIIKRLKRTCIRGSANRALHIAYNCFQAFLPGKKHHPFNNKHLSLKSNRSMHASTSLFSIKTLSTARRGYGSGGNRRLRRLVRRSSKFYQLRVRQSLLLLLFSPFHGSKDSPRSTRGIYAGGIRILWGRGIRQQGDRRLRRRRRIP